MEDEVFDTTYQIVVGDMSVEMFVNEHPTINLLYDPFELSNKDFIFLLDQLIEYYIYKEEYLKCAKLRDIKDARDSHDKILKEIVLDVLDDELEFYPGPKVEEITAMGKLIDTIKNIDPNTFTDGLKNMIKKEPSDSVTDAEMWSIMSSDDKKIFKDSFADFYKWVKGLPEPIRGEYIDRLLDDKPLIPYDNIKEKLEDRWFWESRMKEEYLEDEIDFIGEEEGVDYMNNVVISFLDKYTIMSHTDLTKLKEIRTSLIMHGILDIELRKKGNVHSLIYNSSQKPQRPNWN